MFRDRREAGEALAEALSGLALPDPVVLALPRGGVPVAAPVAARLAAPLDLILVRKIGAPGHEELAVGAVVDGPAHATVFNPKVLEMLRLDEADFAEAVEEKLAEIEARRVSYLGGAAPVPVAARTAIVVDDGIATGATVKAALLGLRRRAPREIVLAVPVAPAERPCRTGTARGSGGLPRGPEPFHAVGVHYLDFTQVQDAEVVALVVAARERMRTCGDAGETPGLGPSD
jgi:putative phosphoribosyl transferase